MAWSPHKQCAGMQLFGEGKTNKVGSDTEKNTTIAGAHSAGKFMDNCPEARSRYYLSIIANQFEPRILRTLFRI